MNRTVEPAVIKLPLSSYENMQMELAWRGDDLKIQFKEIYDALERIKEKFLFDDFQEIAPLFDPLKTIGKYQWKLLDFYGSRSPLDDLSCQTRAAPFISPPSVNRSVLPLTTTQPSSPSFDIIVSSKHGPPPPKPRTTQHRTNRSFQTPNE